MKLLSIVKLIIKTEKKWARLPRVDIAIFDTLTGAYLYNIIQGHSLYCIDIRGESYHMPTLLSACWQYILCLGKMPISYLYFSMFIIKLRAKICITGQDAAHIFYELDKLLPTVRFIAVQQGLKDIYSIGPFSKVSGDYFVFGQAYADILANGVSNVYPCGSIKSNATKLRLKKFPRLCYISTFSGHDLCSKTFRNVNYAEFTYPATYSTLREIDHFCSTQGIELIIASRVDRKSPMQDQNHVFRSEWELYENILRRKPPLINANSYELAGDSELVVCGQSTLGYELLGRDCKVVFINLVAYYHQEKSYGFGWPLALPKQGPFWTNEYDQEHIQNILNHVWHMPSKEWKALIVHYQGQLMYYDQDNSILLNHIKSILNPSLK